MSKNNRQAEAQKLYQRTVDLFPRTVGDELARKALLLEEALIEPTAERIRKGYLECPEPEIEASIFALADHRFQESFGLISDRLASSKAWERNRLIYALGILGDQRAAPVLRKIVVGHEDSASCLHGLRALHQLGDDSLIVPYLKDASFDQNDFFGTSDRLDQLLREIYGEGPALKIEFSTKLVEVRKAWLEWLGQNSKTIPHKTI